MKVEITHWAKSCLREIYNYYCEKATEEKAMDIVNQIIDRAESLGTLSNRGREEDDLKTLGKGHRYVVEWHYRIIYRIEDETVFVTDVFSNWQNPESKESRNQ